MSAFPIFIRRNSYLGIPILPRYNFFLLVGFFCLLFVFWLSGELVWPHPLVSVLVLGLIVYQTLFLFLLPKGILEYQEGALVISWRQRLPFLLKKETISVQDIQDIYLSGDLSWTKAFFAYRSYARQRVNSNRMYSIVIRRKKRQSIEFIGVSPAETDRILSDLKGLKISVVGDL